MNYNIAKPIKLTMVLSFFLLAFTIPSFAQQKKDDAVKIELTRQMTEWIKDLYKPGVEAIGDSVNVSTETALLMQNEDYRKLVFPKDYTWHTAKVLIEKHDLKKAFWYFINLYSLDQASKETVVRSVLTYNSLFKMDEVLKSVFYTYSLVDPEVGKIENGHSEVTAPHILEKKLQNLKELLIYISKYNAANVNAKP